MELILLTAEEAEVVRGGTMQPVLNFEPTNTYRLNAVVKEEVKQKLGYEPNVVPADAIVMWSEEMI